MFWLWLVIALLLGVVHAIALFKSEPTKNWRLVRDISGLALSFAAFQVGWEFGLL